MQQENLALPLPPFNANVACPILVDVLRREVERIGLQRVVVGVSGGIDSAVSLFLAVEAFGADKVHAVALPYRESSADSLQHAQEALDKTGLPYREIDITPMADGWFNQASEITAMRKGNFLARLRMNVLYDLSAQESALVIGTSNKTEMLLGYSTLWGDMAHAVNPLGDLYKCQVRNLASHLNVPNEIIAKPPSADLWAGQTDEEDLEASYDYADALLYHRIDLAFSEERIYTILKQAGEDSYKAQNLLKRVRKNQFKRKMPVIIKMSERTINREFRYPRDWGV